MADAADRALAAFQDVLAVEWNAEHGHARILTLSDCYHAVPEDGMHLCPDREYNDVELCKHLYALEATRDSLGVDVPEGWLVVEDLEERTDEPFALDPVQRPREDCQRCHDELACPTHYGLTLAQDGERA